MKLETINRQQV